jgi:hypothetical protein
VFGASFDFAVISVRSPSILDASRVATHNPQQSTGQLITHLSSGPTALKRWVKLSGSACYPAFVGKLDKFNYPSLQIFRTTSHYR